MGFYVLFSHVCEMMCICMCTFMWGHVGMCVPQWKSEGCVRFLSSPSILSEAGFLVHWYLLSFWGFSCLCLLSGFTTSSFTWVLRIRTLVLVSARQTFYPLAWIFWVERKKGGYREREAKCGCGLSKRVYFTVFTIGIYRIFVHFQVSIFKGLVGNLNEITGWFLGGPWKAYRW